VAQDSRPEVRYVGMCIGDKNVWVSCPGIPLPERLPKKPKSMLRLIGRLKRRPETFHIVAEPTRELDLFEFTVWEKFHDADIPITFVDRSWLYQFRESLPDGDQYYIDADLVERYGREKRPKPNPLPSLELRVLASTARTIHIIEQGKQLFTMLHRGSESADESIQAPSEGDPLLDKLKTSLREGLRRTPGLFEVIQKYCSKTGADEAIATLVFVLLPDSIYAEIGVNPEDQNI
jgi:hypothetical protein